MKPFIPILHRKSDSSVVINWLKCVISGIGPCFHFDTPPEDYIRHDGMPLLSKLDCKRLSKGLIRATRTLGLEGFERLSLEESWKQLGVRYDERLNLLVPITPAPN